MDSFQGPLHNKPDYLICTCLGVMYSEIIAAIDAGAATFEQLQDTLLVGTGCNSCVAEIQEILRERSPTP